MGKISDKYYILKKNNKKKLYLFEGGLFYIFVNDDAKYISSKYGLKVTSFGYDVKCGFPVKNLDKYLEIFKKEKIEIVSNKSEKNTSEIIITTLNKIDLDKITPFEALEILHKLKRTANEE